MKKLALVCALAFGLTLSGCAAGPHQLRRSVSDFDNKTYVANPWVNAAMWLLPLPVMYMGAGIGDFFVTDAYSFWFKDAWDGKGTAFTHFTVKPVDGAMHSLMSDDGKFLEVK